MTEWYEILDRNGLSVCELLAYTPDNALAVAGLRGGDYTARRKFPFYAHEYRF